MPHIVIAAIVGSGLMSGLLFAFSVVVMRALRELPAPVGMFAMQRINVLIINPLFLLVFLGTAMLCAAVGVLAVRGLGGAAAPWLVAGAVAYLAGPLGVTVAFNVPLNNRLATVPADRAEAEWPAYVKAWLVWNHVRTALGALSVGLLGMGLAVAG